VLRYLDNYRLEKRGTVRSCYVVAPYVRQPFSWPSLALEVAGDAGHSQKTLPVISPAKKSTISLNLHNLAHFIMRVIHDLRV
jgi:hypothetical protein